mmetsp:Transcript_18628/g.59169  ORF Transcript_18628/g.59169 Transcript_18628/m.59169 type:complete len:219 (-) Transcript_18628:161-817(-)
MLGETMRGICGGAGDVPRADALPAPLGTGRPPARAPFAQLVALARLRLLRPATPVLAEPGVTVRTGHGPPPLPDPAGSAALAPNLRLPPATVEPCALTGLGRHGPELPKALGNLAVGAQHLSPLHSPPAGGVAVAPVTSSPLAATVLPARTVCGGSFAPPCRAVFRRARGAAHFPVSGPLTATVAAVAPRTCLPVGVRHPGTILVQRILGPLLLLRVP